MKHQYCQGNKCLLLSNVLTEVLKEAVQYKLTLKPDIILLCIVEIILKILNIMHYQLADTF